MSTFAPDRLPDRRPAVLGGLAILLVGAFVVAPGLLAGSIGGHAGLLRTLRRGFRQFWGAGDRTLPPDLQDAVAYWTRYHAVKVVTAALLLAVLARLAVVLWRAWTRGGRPRLAVAAGAVSALGLFCLLLVMANLQGLLAPFSSLLPMLGRGTPGSALDVSVDQAIGQLAAARPSPALQVMVDDFGWYHAVMAVIASVAGVALLGVAGVLLRCCLRAPDRRARRVLGALAALSLLVALFLAALVVANVGVAADPSPAFLDFLRGGW